MTDIDRRRFLSRAGGLSLALAASFPRIGQAAKAAPITMVINQSPWFDGFRQLVEQYQKETGNRIQLDVNPYAGALEKIRNSLRASAGHLRPARDRQQLDGRDVRRRLPRLAHRSRSVVQARSAASARSAARSTGTTS